MKTLFAIVLLAALAVIGGGQTPATSQYPTSLDTATTLLTAANGCSTTLNGAITNSATSITVNSQTCFPATGIFAIESEYLIYTASTSTSFTVTRGAFGSAAASHTNGQPVRLSILAAYHNVLKDAVIATQTKLGSGSATPANNQALLGNGSGTSTWGQITGAYIATSSTPQFARLGLGAAGDSTHLLKLSGGTVTADTHLIDGAITWNAGGVTFSADKINVTDTASASASLLIDRQVGGSSKFSVDKSGNATFGGAITVTSCTGCAGGGSGANTALSNLASVSINTALLAQSGVDLGSTAKPFQDLYVVGAGTYATNYFKVTGTPTAARTITLPDASLTVLGRADTATVSNKTIDNSNTLSGYVDSTRITAPSNPSSGNLRVFANNSTGKLACLDSSGADCMPSGGGGSGTVNSGAQYAITYYPSTGTTVDDLATLTTDAQGKLTLAPTASSSGSPSLLVVTGPAHTALAASTEATDLNFNLNRTVQFSTGALSTQRAVRFQAPTYGFVGASTLSDAYTVEITTPTAGTNATITRSTGLHITGTNNGDHLAWFDHKIFSTGDTLALGIAGGKVVRFPSKNGTINSVFNDNGDLSSSATDGFIYVPQYSNSAAPSGTPTGYNGSQPTMIQKDTGGIYTLWGYVNSGWRDFGGQYKRWDTSTGTGAQTINFNSSTSASVGRQFTFGAGNATLSFSNPPQTGAVITVLLIQDSTGSRTITWPASVKWVGGTAPTLTTTANAKDLFHFLYDGTNYLEIARALDVK